MAIDTEAKRWNMLQVASGPIWSHVFNPSGSNADTVTERATILSLYGGNGFDAPAVVVDAPPAKIQRVVQFTERGRVTSFARRGRSLSFSNRNRGIR